MCILESRDDLEVVGESAHQDVLWHLAHANIGEKVRREIVAVLVPEPDNRYDPNAIAVHIDGQVVGHLPRTTAREYLAGLRTLMAARSGHVALRGVIAGGGYYADGFGRLGVWLEHNPADFGILPSPRARQAPPGHAPAGSAIRRTGKATVPVT
ncbi:MAG TPA: HIRAN domain-containing protein [Streptosporangiaceae bacterium]|nr:HIRAN domain-containing protein [Streptosporangiaceae bacterium]